MTVKKIVVRICVITLILSFVASTHASNRNDVFSEIERINTIWNDISIDLWINDFENDAYPGVLVGDELVYRVKTNKPAFFAFILVDSRGNMTVLKPDALSSNGITGASQSLMFPSEEESQSGQGSITQAMPLGKETIFLLASDKPVPASVFGLDSLTDYANYRADLSESRGLVDRLNAYSKDMKVAVIRYEYIVGSDTQFSNGSGRTPPFVPPIIVEVILKKRAELSGIFFEYDSDELTARGFYQLEFLGSKLIDLQEQNQLSKVRLTGHTDSLGSATYNVALSKRRSMAAKRFLVDEFDLPAGLIDTDGVGETDALESNETNDGRARNRRVDFEIVR